MSQEDGPSVVEAKRMQRLREDPSALQIHEDGLEELLLHFVFAEAAESDLGKIRDLDEVARRVQDEGSAGSAVHSCLTERTSPAASPCARRGRENDLVDSVCVLPPVAWQASPCVATVLPPAVARHVSQEGYARRGSCGWQARDRAQEAIYFHARPHLAQVRNFGRLRCGRTAVDLGVSGEVPQEDGREGLSSPPW